MAFADTKATMTRHNHDGFAHTKATMTRHDHDSFAHAKDTMTTDAGARLGDEELRRSRRAVMLGPATPRPHGA
jgi:hypothetical protein